MKNWKKKQSLDVLNQSKVIIIGITIEFTSSLGSIHNGILDEYVNNMAFWIENSLSDKPAEIHLKYNLLLH